MSGGGRGSSDVGRLLDLFEEARERTPAERHGILERLAPEPGVLDTLERMLAEHDSGKGVLDGRPVDIEAAEWVERLVGSEIGPYRIDGVLGEGGMGIVFAATQEQPLRREVALKLIKLGMDTREVLRRFATERDALARMQHPGIARVLDAGSTAAGRPFFVMERVAGRPLERYCDEERLDLAARIRMLVQLCQAVQHAHQRGIVHRDLKSSNVLVAESDAAPWPKIIDFGIAKATDAAAGLTHAGRLLGTPEFMSPEQLAGKPVDTRADIYALGALAFRLLSGFSPLPGGPATGHEAVRSRLAEQEAPLPSEAAATAPPDRLAAAAVARATTPGRLLRALRGEIDWIVHRAMDADPERRYAAASALAADFERHLAGLPVSVGPPGAGYRARKFLRRHWTGAAAATLLLAAAAGFTVAVDLQSRRVARALQEAEAQRDRAERQLARANEVTRILTGLFDASDPTLTGGGDVLARDLLEAGLARVRDDDSGDPAMRAELLSTLGRVFRNLGEYARAEELLRESVSLGTETLGDDDPAVAVAAEELSETLRVAGRWREAQPFAELALAARTASPQATPLDRASALTELAAVHIYASRDVEALPMLREALAIREAGLPDDHPLVAEARSGLAVALTRSGADLDEAVELSRRAVATARADLPARAAALATALNNLGRALRAQGQHDASAEAIREAIETHRRVLGPWHPNVAVALGTLGTTLHDAGDLAGAEQAERAAAAIYRRADPDGLDLANQLGNLASTLQGAGKLDEAADAYAEALEIRARGGGAEDAQAAVLAHNLAGLQRQLGEHAAALATARRAADLARRSFGTEHANTGIILGRAASITCDSDTAAALELFAEAAGPLASLGAEHWRVGVHRSLLGRCLLRAGRHDEAERELLAARDILAQRGPDDANLRATETALRELYETTGRPASIRPRNE